MLEHAVFLVVGLAELIGAWTGRYLAIALHDRSLQNPVHSITGHVICLTLMFLFYTSLIISVVDTCVWFRFRITQAIRKRHE